MRTARERASKSSKVFWAMMAAITMMTACKKNKDRDKENDPIHQQPAISNFSPARGIPGTEVTINGKNFAAEKSQNRIRFSGSTADAEVIQGNTTELKVKVPPDATTGKFSLKVGSETVMSATDFTVDPEPASITDFQPKQGPFNTEVTITGKKFPQDVNVTINDVPAAVKSNSATQIVISIPVDTRLTAHKIRVTSNGLNLQTAQDFTVTAPGPYGQWENTFIQLLPTGGSAYFGGTSFVYKNKIYWGFSKLVTTATEATYAVFDPAQPALGWVLENAPVNMAPASVQGFTSVVNNDRVFMGTGLIGTGPASTASAAWWEFFPETKTSTAKEDFSTAARGVLSFSLNGKIYAGFGGTNKILSVFSPDAGTGAGIWNPVGTANLRELNSGSAVVIGNDVIMGRALYELNQDRTAMYKYNENSGISRVADLPDNTPVSITPSFSVNGKGYYVVGNIVWEYTPDAGDGVWRAVVAQPAAPTILHTAVVTTSGTKVVYGWAVNGLLYKFKFN